MLLLTLERLLLLLTLVGLKNQALVSALIIILLKLPKQYIVDDLGLVA